VLDVAACPDANDSSVEVMQGAIDNANDVAAAVSGVRVVIHLAAKVQPSSTDSDELMRVNAGGTKTLASAAAAAGVEQFIHLSSAGVYGHPRQPNPFREDDELRATSAYQRSKLEAERQLLSVDRQSMRVNILRPAGIYGPGSMLEIPAYRAIRSRRWSVELAGGVLVHPTHVSDVVGAILALIDDPAPDGSVMNVGGERPILLQEFQALVASELGAQRHRVTVSPKIATPVAAMAAIAASTLGHPKPLLTAFARGALVSSAVDDRLFRGRYPTVSVMSLEAGLRGHLDWAREQSLL